MNQLFFLSRSTKIVVDKGIPVLRQTQCGVSHRLQLGEAIALSFLAAVGRRDEAVDACSAEIDNGALWIDHVIDRYGSYLGGDRPVPLDFGWLSEVNFDALTTSNISRKDAAPKGLVWLVTLACHRRCSYCYYDVTPHDVSEKTGPADATFSKSAIFRMLAEMGRIGASDLYLTGGEPLLRNDLIDILAEAKRRRVRTHLNTRYPIDKNLAHRLRDAKPHSITYSLDAGNRKMADGLSGDRGFFQEAVQALKELRKAGLDPEVNAVLMRANADQFDDLARLLVDCGIGRLSISLFIPPPTQRSSTRALTPVQDDFTQLSMIKKISKRWADKINIRLGDSGRNLGASTDADHPVCEVGFSELHVLPDGNTTRCRYLPSEKALQLGSLENKSIMEVWKDTPLEELNTPSRSTYEGTPCRSCGEFENCNERGRCYASALQRCGTLAGPDSFCRMGSI